MGQAIFNGILLGGLYALVGVGMNVIFGIVKLTNLAHGDFIILASYLGLSVCTALGIPPLLSLVIVIPIMFFIGFLLQSALVNRVISRGPEPPLLVMFGLSIIIQNLLLSFFSSDAQHMRSSLETASITITDKTAIPIMYLIDFAIGIVVIYLLNLFLRRTYVGQSIRATSDDTMAAQLMGINVKTTYGIAMGVAMATAAVAGVLIGMSYNFYPTTSSQYLIISFGVVVIGGMGSIRGTLFAGIIFGLAQLLGAYYFGTSVQMLCGYLVILVMLVVRPQGLFAK
ncbi:MAG: branched-chain amino acid ABC transporter permease [Oscillospiraceae bacterium]|nr:branched-chain amino acid ABC transporter permease [Oscillospiraceae bacterium]